MADKPTTSDNNQYRNWLQRMLDRWRSHARGDVIVGQVGEKASNVLIGKNIIQIGSLVLPVLPVIALLIILIVIAATLIYVFVWPKWQIGPMDGGNYNIAVAPFHVIDEHNQPTTNTFINDQVKSIANILDADRDSLYQLLGGITVAVWGPDLVARSAGELRSGQEETFTQRLNAHVLLYGEAHNLGGNEWELTPKFFLRDKAIQNADELRGEYALGQAIPFTVGSVSSQGDVNRILRVRIAVLVQILRGLSYYTRETAEGYENAAELFQRTADESEWSDNIKEQSGQEVLYHFLGKSYEKLGLLAEINQTDRQAFLEQSSKAYQQALDHNARYARSYIGLGSVLFHRARPLQTDSDPCGWDWPLLDNATQQYIHARNISHADQPTHAYVRLHADTGLGQIYFYQGGCQNPQYWNIATLAFESVLNDYMQLSEKEQIQVSTLATIAHTNLGLINYFRALNVQRNPTLDTANLTRLLSKATVHLSQAMGLARQIKGQEGRQHREAVLPYLLNSYCLQEDHEMATNVLADFLREYSESEKLKSEIRNRIMEGCIHE